MQTLMKHAAVGAACLLLLACAGPVTQRTAVDQGARAQEERNQQLLAVKTAAELEMRIWTVGYGILKGAAPECGKTIRPSFGLWVLSRDRVPAANQDLLSKALNLDASLRVLAVYKGGAAEAAGVKAGDIVLDASSRAITPAGGPETREAAAARLPAGAPVTIQLQRKGAPLTVTMTPDTVCDYPLKVAQSGEVNAFADGKGIFVTRGMMRFATDDRELALVIGHELGHNTMGQTDKQKTNAALGAMVDILAAAYRVNTQSAFMKAGAQVYSQEFESEADYVGMYYLARAGYNTEGAADFWRRMAAEYPGSIKTNHAASHPATTERFLALEKVSVEVQTKESSGLALLPNRIETNQPKQASGGAGTATGKALVNTGGTACSQGAMPC